MTWLGCVIAQTPNFLHPHIGIFRFPFSTLGEFSRTFLPTHPPEGYQPSRWWSWKVVREEGQGDLSHQGVTLPLPLSL